MNFRNNTGKFHVVSRRITAGIASFVLAGTLFLQPFGAAAVQAKSITTPSSSISKKTNVDIENVTINSDNRTRTYRVFAQGGGNYSKSSFVAQHGCAVCSLTTVLSGYSRKYAHYTPKQTYQKLEKKVFGTSRWKSNYNKSMSAQRPISLYGISKVLSYCDITNRYVRHFKDKSAIREIKNHLKSGNAVIIEVNNHKQKNGHIYSSYTNRWSSSKHTMVLLGMTDSGKVIVADSAYRKWSGSKQRIKFTTMKHLVQYMLPCTRTSTSVYYNSSASCGGYILVNPD